MKYPIVSTLEHTLQIQMMVHWCIDRKYKSKLFTIKESSFMWVMIDLDLYYSFSSQIQINILMYKI